MPNNQPNQIYLLQMNSKITIAAEVVMVVTTIMALNNPQSHPRKLLHLMYLELSSGLMLKTVMAL